MSEIHVPTGPYDQVEVIRHDTERVEVCSHQFKRLRNAPGKDSVVLVVVEQAQAAGATIHDVEGETSGSCLYSSRHTARLYKQPANISDDELGNQFIELIPELGNYCFRGSIWSRFAACQANTATTVAACFTSSIWTRSTKSMFV